MLYEVITRAEVGAREVRVEHVPPLRERHLVRVITSYSIHYTKLYDAALNRAGDGATEGASGAASLPILISPTALSTRTLGQE